MKRFPYMISLIFGVVVALVSCSNDDSNTWEKYEDWRNLNNDFFETKTAELNSDDSYAYERLSTNWDRGSYILMKRLKNGTGNEKPLYTSYAKVIYKGYLCGGTPFDSTYLYADSATTLKISGSIQGFSMALTNMVVGDSCEVIIPAYIAYQDQESGRIKPYSTLIFGVKLIEIVGYERPPLPE